MSVFLVPLRQCGLHLPLSRLCCPCWNYAFRSAPISLLWPVTSPLSLPCPGQSPAPAELPHLSRHLHCGTITTDWTLHTRLTECHSGHLRPSTVCAVSGEAACWSQISQQPAARRGQLPSNASGPEQPPRRRSSEHTCLQTNPRTASAFAGHLKGSRGHPWRIPAALS